MSEDEKDREEVDDTGKEFEELEREIAKARPGSRPTSEGGEGASNTPLAGDVPNKRRVDRRGSSRVEVVERHFDYAKPTSFSIDSETKAIFAREAAKRGISQSALLREVARKANWDKI